MDQNPNASQITDANKKFFSSVLKCYIDVKVAEYKNAVTIAELAPFVSYRCGGEAVSTFALHSVDLGLIPLSSDIAFFKMVFTAFLLDDQLERDGVEEDPAS